MSTPLPHRPSIDQPPRDTHTVSFDDEHVDDVLSILSCETARTLLATLDDGPATASDLSEQLDMSLQTVCYHLDKLSDADIVADVGTWYSSKGAEMTVYGTTIERFEIAFPERR